MSACSSSFRDIINISVVSFHCIHSWFIKPWYSLENVEFSQSWRGNTLIVFVWTRNNLIFNLKRGAEKKQVQTPLSVCVCVCLRKKHKVEGESGMLCVCEEGSVCSPSRRSEGCGCFCTDTQRETTEVKRVCLSAEWRTTTLKRFMLNIKYGHEWVGWLSATPKWQTSHSEKWHCWYAESLVHLQQVCWTLVGHLQFR